MKLKEHAKDILAFSFRHCAPLRRFAVFGTAQAENDRLANLIRFFAVDRIVDVGANHGQFANDMRRAGFRGLIHSFEPVRECYHYLRTIADGDPSWKIYGYALGNESGERSMNVANNGALSSSLLDEIDLDYGYGVRFVDSEDVKIKRFDDVFRELELGSKCLFKLDTQGYETFVIEGARAFLAQHRPIVFLESSLFPNYKDERLFDRVHDLLSGLDYRLVLVRKQIGNFQVDLQADFAFLHQDDFDAMLAHLRRDQAEPAESYARADAVARPAE